MAAQPEWMDYLRPLLALGVVAGLIFFLGQLLRKTGVAGRFTGKKGEGSLSVVETLFLDPRHRLVLVRCGTKEHLLLLGGAGDLVVESREADDAG